MKEKMSVHIQTYSAMFNILKKYFKRLKENFYFGELTFYGLDRRDIERFLCPFDELIDSITYRKSI